VYIRETIRIIDALDLQGAARRGVHGNLERITGKRFV